MSKLDLKAYKIEILIGSFVLLLFGLIFYSYFSVKKKYCYTYNGVFITQIQKHLFSDWNVRSSTGQTYYSSSIGNSRKEPDEVYIYHPRIVKPGLNEFEIFKFSKTTFQGIYIQGATNINYDNIKDKKVWMYCVDTKDPKALFGVG